jgi:hypothetical protein
MPQAAYHYHAPYHVDVPFEIIDGTPRLARPRLRASIAPKPRGACEPAVGLIPAAPSPARERAVRAPDQNRLPTACISRSSREKSLRSSQSYALSLLLPHLHTWGLPLCWFPHRDGRAAGISLVPTNF